MQIVKAEIIKTRQEHRKTKYRVVYTVKSGFWIFSTCRRAMEHFQFETYEQAHRYIVRVHPDVKEITIGGIK